MSLLSSQASREKGEPMLCGGACIVGPISCMGKITIQEVSLAIQALCPSSRVLV